MSKNLLAKVDIWKFRGYDHIHWSKINDGRVPKGFGTLTDLDNPKKDKGKVVLLGRGASGYHYTLLGPMTMRQWRKRYQ